MQKTGIKFAPVTGAVAVSVGDKRERLFDDFAQFGVLI